MHRRFGPQGSMLNCESTWRQQGWPAWPQAMHESAAAPGARMQAVPLAEQ
jgi:hypothetical protein